MRLAEYAAGMRGTSNGYKLVGKPDDKGVRGDVGEHGRVMLNGSYPSCAKLFRIQFFIQNISHTFF